MTMRIAGLDDGGVRQLAREIDEKGFAVVPGFVDADELARAQSFAREAVERKGGQYAGFVGAGELEGTVLADIPRSGEFQSLCRRLYEVATDRPSPPFELYQVFRCLSGSSGQAHSAVFHYDSYVLTALLPVALPTKGARGDLIVFPNVRPVRRSFVTHFIDKLICENPLAQIVLRSAAKRRRLSAKAMELRPGDLYLFWGYRSLHANEVCDPNELRATALFHYGNPHLNSPVRNAIAKARSRSAAPVPA